MEQVLRYESADTGSLEPGEELIWEGGLSRRGRPRFRITNRRAFCVDGKENAAKHRGTVRWPFHEIITVIAKRRGGATIQLGAMLWLTGVDRWTDVTAHLVEVNRGRLTRRRREAAVNDPEKSMENMPFAEANFDVASVDDAELGLLDGERVLWAGRPVGRQPISWPVVRGKLITLAMLACPTAMVIRIASDRQFDAADAIFALVAAAWFPLSIHSLTTKPLFRRMRLQRTRYVLTSRRAFVIEYHGGAKKVKFVFVDALAATFARTVQPDGSGSVNVSLGFDFVQIANASSVHAKLVEAVIAARRDLPDLGWRDTGPTL